MKNYKLNILTKTKFDWGCYGCDWTDSGDGRIVIPYTKCDVGDPKLSYYLYSEDNGKTFTDKTKSSKESIALKKLDDGSYLGFAFNNIAFKSVYNTDFGPIPYCLPTYRAKNFDDYLAEKITTEIKVLNIPELNHGFGDSANEGAGCISGWKQLSNGDILLTMYGNLKGDINLCPYFQKWGVYDFYLYRTWYMISHDRGDTWEFGGTLADTQTYPIADINAEGYCETDIIEVEDGHIVAVIRTGGHEVVSPLYCMHSYDYGKTWGDPYEICDIGVLPKLLKMTDGRLVCASGHPSVFLLVSDDGGITWSDALEIIHIEGKWGNTSSGYNAIFECEDGIISLVYDDPTRGMQEQNDKQDVKREMFAITLRIEEE